MERLTPGFHALFGARRRIVRDRAALVEAIRAGASYLGQGAAYAYLRARSGTQGPRLFQDEVFAAQIAVCGRAGFAAAVEDLLLIVEGMLRPHLALDAPTLGELYAEAVAAEPEVAAELDLDARRAAFRARAEAAIAAPPADAATLSRRTARAIMDSAPVEAAIQESDFDMVANNTAFRFTDYRRNLARELHLPDLARALAPAERAA